MVTPKNMLSTLTCISDESFFAYFWDFCGFRKLLVPRGVGGTSSYFIVRFRAEVYLEEERKDAFEEQGTGAHVTRNGHFHVLALDLHGFIFGGSSLSII